MKTKLHSLFIGLVLLAGVHQAAAQTYALGTNNLLEGPAAGTDSVALAVSPATLTWINTANDAWLHLSADNQSGAGSKNLVFTFYANPGATRTGTLSVAGLTLTVTQAGFTYVAANPVTALVSSRLNRPGGLAVDSAGNVYIPGPYDNTIKELPRAFVDPTAMTE